MMERDKLIIEQRGLVLGKEKGYFAELVKTMNVLTRLSFQYVRTTDEFVEKLYTYEPMLILAEMTPENLSVLETAARLKKLRQSVVVGLTDDNPWPYMLRQDELFITEVIQRMGDVRQDSFAILTVYKHTVKFGINLDSVSQHMPIVNEFTWHDVAYDEKLLRDFLSDKLDRLGVRRSLAGHKYLIAAIAMQVGIRRPPEPKKLYKLIAEFYDTTPLSVEKAIRYAIETAWVSGDIEYQDEMFGFTTDYMRGKPTNAEFIARLALDYA